MRAEIIAVGSELLTPFRQDTNSLWLTGELNRLGIRVVHKAIVGDDPDEMRSVFRASDAARGRDYFVWRTGADR